MEMTKINCSLDYHIIYIHPGQLLLSKGISRRGTMVSFFVVLTESTCTHNRELNFI